MDVAVLEVGLGGRLDATNVVRAPVVCGVASLGFDHMEVPPGRGLHRLPLVSLTLPLPLPCPIMPARGAASLGSGLMQVPHLYASFAVWEHLIAHQTATAARRPT